MPVSVMHNKRKALSLTQIESELLLKISKGIPPDIQARYSNLIAKRQSETLTPNDHDELLRPTRKVEKLEARRVEYLAELARLRGISMTALMKNLGIRPRAYD